MSIAICPGSFDPMTLGHLNIIRRTSRVFEKVIVLIMVNPGKHSPLFSIEERLELCRRVCRRFKNVTVECSHGLLADYAKSYGNVVIVKGLRANTDFESEFKMALINKKLNPSMETMFLTSSEKYTYISSSMVKELAAFGLDLSDFVPREILSDVVKKADAMMGRKTNEQ